MTILGAILAITGVFLITAGTIGFIRMPDFFTRMHAIGKSDTLGALLALLGVACWAGWSLVSLKVLIAALFIFIANPTASHAIARAGLLSGVEPWTKHREEE